MIDGKTSLPVLLKIQDTFDIVIITLSLKSRKGIVPNLWVVNAHFLYYLLAMFDTIHLPL
jgi:hypothetical protein